MVACGEPVAAPLRVFRAEKQLLRSNWLKCSSDWSPEPSIALLVAWVDGRLVFSVVGWKGNIGLYVHRNH